nr:immunoglobulin heavy chain junction region [Macaca mulatta]MOX60922.1 immunoglobulin heavy chain junction region [Macaca mulatta]MOX61348.1 immunoglobulin heavy chain junction region [Macaca mulatta]MOX62805.1 immunoglobulin heavy chain junction region [Macaca mulatta]MOX64281.1 immunoglobulin heavy chain junction region [Macaca mulatta]
CAGGPSGIWNGWYFDIW